MNECELKRRYGSSLKYFFVSGSILQSGANVASHGLSAVNLLTPNVNYSGRTAPLTSKVAFYIFIQQI